MGVPVTLPFNLTNGTTADATQVMANFNAIVSALATSAAASGANSDITSLSNLTTPLSPPQGGTTVFYSPVGSSGTAAAQVINPTVPNSFTLQPGYTVIFATGFTAVGGGTTLNINGTGAMPLLKQVAGGFLPIAANDFLAGFVLAVTFVSGNYVLISRVPGN